MVKRNYDFSGWATKNDIKCADGRTIKQNAFSDNDGSTVPLIWNHDHGGIRSVLGHALLENRPEGVYAYGYFNNTDDGQMAKELVRNGDIASLSIYANKLKQKSGDVIHGQIREVSLVLAGANPGALIDVPIAHSEDSEDEGFIFNAMPLDVIEHSDESNQDEELVHAEQKEDNEMAEDTAKKPEETSENDKTVKDVIDSMNEEQKNVMYYMIGKALEDAGANNEDDEESEGGQNMKHNVFENEMDNELTHSAMMEFGRDVIKLAKQSNVGSLQGAIAIALSENDAIAHGLGLDDGDTDALAHGIETIEKLFPEFEDTNTGTPETITRDQSWVASVISGVHKSPISRIRTRQADARIAEMKAKGYQKKGDKKTLTKNIKLLSRTTDPQTIYVRDDMHRDDIIDITEFDVVAYMWSNMKMTMNETLALAFLVGDGREDEDADKIKEEHVRSIYHDDDLYTIHVDVDYEGMKAKLQGTNTGANFGEEYIRAEATIAAALYAREQYKGSGNLTYYCTPHSLNVMLLARDMNGRRMYNSVADLAAALNVTKIETVEQFEGVQREDEEMQKHNLVGLFVNMADYQVGSTKGGELTQFDQFDIDFNKYKYLLETRISGALTKVYSAIALEEKTV